MSHLLPALSLRCFGRFSLSFMSVDLNYELYMFFLVITYRLYLLL